MMQQAVRTVSACKRNCTVNKCIVQKLHTSLVVYASRAILPQTTFCLLKLKHIQPVDIQKVHKSALSVILQTVQKP